MAADPVTRRNRLAVLAAVAAFIIGLCLSPNFHAGNTLYAGDFVQEYAGGWMVRHGEASRLYDEARFRAVQHDPAVVGFTWTDDEWQPPSSPPFWSLLAVPLTYLPFRVAALVFVALMAAAFAAALGIALRAFPAQRVHLPFMLLIAGAFSPLWQSLLSAQKTPLLLLLFTASYVLLRRGRPGSAGIVFGLAGFKPQLLLVIAASMLVRRQWRFLAGVAVTACVFGTLCLALEPTTLSQYLAFARLAIDQPNQPWFPLERMHCWYGFFRLLWPGAPAGKVQAATAAAGLGTLFLLIPLWRRRDDTGAVFTLQWAAVIVATILVSPHLLEYDLALLLLPFLLLGVLLAERRPLLEEHRGLVLTMLAAVFVLAGVSRTLLPWTRTQLSVPAMVGLLAVLALPRRRPA